MPNRIIKESIRTSKNVNILSDFDFRVWLYLITYVDDYGRGSADTELLRGVVFPRRKGITESQIESALARMANIGMICLYKSDGEPYFYFPNWAKHQRIQTKRSKFPEPPSPLSTVGHGEPRLKSNPIQAKSETEIKDICAEPKNGSAPPVIMLPLNDGTSYPVTTDQVERWRGLYPAVDVMQELRNMLGWCDGNPKKLKTRSGIVRFITSWLSAEQNKSGRPGARYAPAPPPRNKPDRAELERLKRIKEAI